jgi:hypothetical protein
MKYTEEQLLKLLSEDNVELYESLSENEKISFLGEILKELKKDNWYIRLFKLCITLFLFDIFLICIYIM